MPQPTGNFAGYGTGMAQGPLAATESDGLTHHSPGLRPLAQQNKAGGLSARQLHAQSMANPQ